MKFLLIKHLIVEGLGIFERFCHNAGISIDTVELEKGDSFPSLEGYSALWVMGGSMNVGDTDDYPWLIEEKALIRRAVRDLQMPYMGICLGAQLLADACGGEVRAMLVPEVGLLPITLTSTGINHPLLQGLPETYKVLLWHGQEVLRLPDGASVLASSSQCPIQAFGMGKAFGLQFHNEAMETTVEDWVQIPAYRDDLEQMLGSTGASNFQKAVAARLPIMKREAKIVFDNFLKIIRA